MPSRAELTIRANAVGLDASTIPNDSKLEQKILYLEKNSTTFAGALATGVLTSDNTNVATTETVTIGTHVYTFKTALTPAANEVLIGVDADTSLTNLRSAINGTGTAGTDYAANTPVNTDVTCGAVTAHAVTVTAISYSITNADIATTETSAHLSWGATTLTGGTSKVIAKSEVVNRGVSGDKLT